MQAQIQGSEFEIDVDGRMAFARWGDTVAAVLLRAGVATFRHTLGGQPRGIFCGMGVCFECLVTIDGLAGQRACITLARPGMRVDTDKS